MTTRLLRVDPERPSPETIEHAAVALRSGGVVAFPTETFYGLGALAHDDAALARIFRIKGRPEDKPLLLLVSSVDMAETVAEVTPHARVLMARHWPGALTLVLRSRPGLSALVTSGTDTVGIRHPGHRVPTALVTRLGVSVTAPSANRSGCPPPTTAEAVMDTFAGEIDVVLDGGPTAGGMPSTVLDLTLSPPLVRRQGAVVVQ